MLQKERSHTHFPITSRPYIFEPTEESGNLSNFFIKVMYSLMSPLSSELGCQTQIEIIPNYPKYLNEYFS